MLWIPGSPLWGEPENTGPTTSKARPRMQSDAKAVTCRMQLPDVARKQNAMKRNGNTMETQWKCVASWTDTCLIHETRR